MSARNDNSFESLAELEAELLAMRAEGLVWFDDLSPDSVVTLTEKGRAYFQ